MKEILDKYGLKYRGIKTCCGPPFQIWGRGRFTVRLKKSGRFFQLRYGEQRLTGWLDSEFLEIHLNEHIQLYQKAIQP